MSAALDLKAAPTDVAERLLACYANADHHRQPFDFWLLRDVLPERDIDDILALPFTAPPSEGYGGRREINNAQRVFFNPQSQARFPVCRRVVEGFQDPRVREALKRTTGAALDGALLRIEYCQDEPGFWLEPHTDIKVKKFTMLVYLLDDPALALAGTDVLEGPPQHRYVTTAPYGRNLGVVFVPSDTSWHGVGHHPIAKSRKSIIINYVSPEWRAVDELA